ncbi:MAG: hypothetical protein D6702_07250 [Planctomycetota bacterium]|nr:MAG: hypothetical protein D6702_07250 [Planctomycetota bacterium]
MSDDPADRLRRAWSRLEPPAPADSWRDADPATRRAVGWLAAAWERVEPPAPVPLPRRRPAPGPARPLLAAAAVLLVAGLGAVLPHLLVRAGGATEATAAAAPPAADRPRLIATRPDRVELRAGTVHLTLLRPPAAPAGPDPTEAE